MQLAGNETWYEFVATSKLARTPSVVPHTTSAGDAESTTPTKESPEKSPALTSYGHESPDGSTHSTHPTKVASAVSSQFGSDEGSVA